MTFDWSQYYQLAKELANLETTSASQEARFRSAISRAYYAAFNTAVVYIEAVEGKNFLPPTADKHFDVREYFLNKRNVVSQRIADDLNYLRNQRNRADYERDTQINLLRTQEIVRRAGLVIHQISQLKR